MNDSARLELTLKAISLAIPLLLYVLSGNCLAAQTGFDLTGVWDSKYGAVQLNSEGIDKNGEGIVSGTYYSGKEQARIVWGRLLQDKNNYTLKMEYYLHWKPLYGYAEFQLDPQKGTLKGNYYQGGQNGEWLLTRRKGGNIPMRSDLPLIREPRSKQGSKSFDVTGDWDSSFGKVHLQGTSLAVVKQLKGTFTRNDGKVGKISFGSFLKTAQGGKLKLNYYCPWNKVEGEAEFVPDRMVGGKMLLGTYKQGTSTGPWILCRPAESM